MTKHEAATLIQTRYPALDVMVGRRAILVSDLHKLGTAQDTCRAWLAAAGFELLGSGATLSAYDTDPITLTEEE